MQLDIINIIIGLTCRVRTRDVDLYNLFFSPIPNHLPTLIMISSRQYFRSVVCIGVCVHFENDSINQIVMGQDTCI